MLEAVLAFRPTASMTDREVRRLRSDQHVAKEELALLKAGRELSEYGGLLSVRRAMCVSEDPQ